MKKISVIVPVYNGEKYITETILSIQNQTYPISEIIIINDGSIDNTQKVVESLAKDFSNIILISQENAGPAKARNSGILQSTGDYIAFCDADDLWDPCKIEKQIQVFLDPTIKLVFTGIRFFGFQNGEYIPDSRWSLKDLFLRNYITNSSVIIECSVFNKVGYFDERKDFFAVEDYQLWLRICTHFEFKGISEPLISYRVHGNQISKKSPDSYKKLVSIYLYFLSQTKYMKYWIICLIKTIENICKYLFYYTIWKLKKP